MSDRSKFYRSLEAQRRTEAQLGFLVEKTKFLDKWRGQLNLRQEKALLRMFREGIDGFKGGLSAGNYVTITGKGALRRAGALRHARYEWAISTGQN